MIEKVKKNEDVVEFIADNSLFSTEFITFLMDKYLPYCYIWSSFGFSGLSISRITNGFIEKNNEFWKSDSPADLLPHLYISKNKDSVKGNCVGFMNKKPKNKPKKIIY